MKLKYYLENLALNGYINKEEKLIFTSYVT